MIPKDYLDEVVSIGELSLDGRINPVNGALPAALSAAEFGKSLFLSGNLRG